MSEMCRKNNKSENRRNIKELGREQRSEFEYLFGVGVRFGIRARISGVVFGVRAFMFGIFIVKIFLARITGVGVV
jgi:hypothetical protein